MVICWMRFYLLDLLQTKFMGARWQYKGGYFPWSETGKTDKQLLFGVDNLILDYWDLIVDSQKA